MFKRLLPFILALLCVGNAATALDQPVKFISGSTSLVSCDDVGQIAVDIVGGSGAWVCRTKGVAGSAVWESMSAASTADSLNDWETCLENANSYERFCVLAPGRYDVGAGKTITMPYTGQTTEERVYAICNGSEFYSSSAITAGGLVEFDISEMEHDHEFHITGCGADGSSGDTDETIIKVTKNQQANASHSGNQAGRLFVDGVDLGEADAGGGTESAFWIDYGGANADSEAEIVFTRSKLNASGHVVQIDKIASTTHIIFDDVTLNGNSGGNTRASNLCLTVNESGDVAGVGATDHSALIMSNMRLLNCGGVGAYIGAVVVNNTSMGTFGSATEDGAIWGLDARSIDLNVTTASTSPSDGPFILLGGTYAASVRARITDSTCAEFDSSAVEVIELTVGGSDPTFTDIDIVGKGSCTATAFGSDLLAAAPIGKGKVSIAGTTYTYNGDGTVRTTPFMGIPNGSAPAATCAAGELFLDTDETVDTNCTTTNDNSLCLCTVANTWVQLNNN